MSEGLRRLDKVFQPVVQDQGTTATIQEKTRGQISTYDSAAKPRFSGFLEKMVVEIIEVFFWETAHFPGNRGFCSRINI